MNRYEKIFFYYFFLIYF